MDSAKPHSLGSRLLTGLAGLLGAFILYLLSAGPVAYLVIRTGSGGLWATNMYVPAMVLLANTPARPAGVAYVSWWIRLAESHRRQK